MINLAIPIAGGLVLAWLIITLLRGGGNSTYIQNPARHGIGDTKGMSDAAIIEQWRRCRIPGCRDCAATAFTRELLLEAAANSDEEGWG